MQPVKNIKWDTPGLDLASEPEVLAGKRKWVEMRLLWAMVFFFNGLLVFYLMKQFRLLLKDSSGWQIE